MRRARLAGGGTSPSRSAAVALRSGGEAARLPGAAEEVGGGEDLCCVAGAGAEALAKDYKRLPETAVAMVYWAMSRIMLRRLVSAVQG